MITGTVQNQVKLQLLDAKWQKKKQDLSAGKADNEGMTAEDRMLQSLESQAEDIRKSRDTEEIYTKLKTGGTLTAEEISYLKEHDPEALAEYEKAQAEKKAYEQQLKNCKTKEDVQRLKMNRMGNFAARAKSIANNPYIPKEKKLELMNRLNNEVCLIRDAHGKFEKSLAYKNLPEESELQEERAKETREQNEEIAANEMEASKEAGSDNSADLRNCDNESENVDKAGHADEAAASDCDISENAAASDCDISENAELKDQTFEKIIHDIERYLQKNSTKKPKFAVRI